jgi:hypothetical protein
MDEIGKGVFGPLPPMTGDTTLRRRLQEITDLAAAQGMTFDQLEDLIKELAATVPHSIQRLPDEANGYRCFVHAFGLAHSSLYSVIAGYDAAIGENVFFAGSNFSRFLIQRAILTAVPKTEARPGDIAVYLGDEGAPKHAGKITSNMSESWRIRSKWGGGLFLEHELWEVPESYGDCTKFYQALSRSIVEKAFLQFVKKQEGAVEFIDQFDLGGLFEDINSR